MDDHAVNSKAIKGGLVDRHFLQRVELKYCERCGTLGVQLAAQRDAQTDTGRNAGCGACRTSLRWLGEVR